MRKTEVKDWYNGYYFGQANVYNPWSMMYYVADHVDEHDKAYDTELLDDGFENIVYYGVSFYGKDCYVVVES